jgi:hypothetical protein
LTDSVSRTADTVADTVQSLPTAPVTDPVIREVEAVLPKSSGLSLAGG